MQRCECTVKLGGDLGNTVRKTMVSPAELVILRHIHGGDDSVTDIQPTMMDKFPHNQERDRLKYVYGGKVVERLFPGQFAKLPVTLKEVEPSIEAPPEEEGDEDDDEPALPENGVVERMEAMDPKPFGDDDLNEDDKALIAMIQEANNIGALRAIATSNEVEVTSLPAEVADAKLHLVRSLFPMYRQ